MYVYKLIEIYKINVHKIIFDYTASEYSTTFNLDLASLLVHFTGVPLGYYSHICTTKVSQSVYRLFYKDDNTFKIRKEISNLLYLQFRLFYCIFFIYRSLWNMRNYIHCMLCGSMFTAQLVYTFGINRTENEVL